MLLFGEKQFFYQFWIKTKTWTKIERTRHEQINSKRKNALKLLDQYDSQLAKTSFELGISKHTKIVVRQKKEK